MTAALTCARLLSEFDALADELDLALSAEVEYAGEEGPATITLRMPDRRQPDETMATELNRHEFAAFLAGLQLLSKGLPRAIRWRPA